MEIITNNKPRENLTWRQLTPKEQKEFDYFDPANIGNFFRYKGEIYDLGEFMQINQSIAPHPQRTGWENWQGYFSDSYFSGVLVRYASDNESIIVGRYFS
jgi:hypothetical protein